MFYVRGVDYEINPNPSTVHVVLNWYWVHTLIKVTAKIKLVHKIDLVCDHLKHPKRLLITN